MKNSPSLQDSIILAFSFALLLWTIKLAESVLNANLTQLGVFPNTPGGLFGVVTAPLIHGSWQHLINNTLPVLLLGSMLIYGYPKSRWWVLTLIWALSGIGVWFFGRSSYHIGVSGLTHGVLFFLLIAGLLRRDKRSSALLMVAFFMYGTMIWSIFPHEPGISFEYHFFGAVSGTVCAILFCRTDPGPMTKTYTWEQAEVFEEDDPIIGDQWKIVAKPSAPEEQ